MCAAFLHRPRAVLVDEPMVGLDPRGARLIKEVFRAMSREGRGDPDEHAHPRGGRGDVRPHQHHPQGAHHRPRHGGRAARAGGRRGRAAHPGVPEADRRQRRCRRSTTVSEPAARRPPSRTCCCPTWCVGPQPRAAPRAGRRRARRRSSAASASLVGAAIFAHRLLAHLAAARLRGAGRLPGAPGPLLALPDVPLVPGLQRHRHRALDVLPLRGPAPAAGRAGAAAPALLLALRADRRARPRWMVVVFLLPGAARGRPRPLRAAPLYYAGGRADRRAVRRDPRGAGLPGHPAARQRLPRPPRARRADADGPALRAWRSS